MGENSFGPRACTPSRPTTARLAKRNAGRESQSEEVRRAASSTERRKGGANRQPVPPRPAPAHHEPLQPGRVVAPLTAGQGDNFRPLFQASKRRREGSAKTSGLGQNRKSLMPESSSTSRSPSVVRGDEATKRDWPGRPGPTWARLGPSQLEAPGAGTQEEDTARAPCLAPLGLPSRLDPKRRHIFGRT